MSKIIQIVSMPDGNLCGLDDEGTVYVLINEAHKLFADKWIRVVDGTTNREGS